MAGSTRHHPAHADDWYVRSFGELYPLLYRHRDDEQARGQVDELVELLGLRVGRRVLDICCGAGRHLEALRAAGLDAFGLDLSAPLLRRAAQRPGLRERIVRADVRALPFEGRFQAAVNLFTSFGYFPDERENAGQLRQMARCLRPGGLLLMDLPNRAALEHEIEPHSVEEVDGLHVEHRRRFAADRMIKCTTVTDGGEPREFTESVRVYWPDELTAMAAAAGLGRVRLFGGFDGRPFNEEAERMIVIGERMGAGTASGVASEGGRS